MNRPAAKPPGTVAGLPGTVAGLPGTVAGLPGTVARLPGTVAGLPGTVAETRLRRCLSIGDWGQRLIMGNLMKSAWTESKHGRPQDERPGEPAICGVAERQVDRNRDTEKEQGHDDLGHTDTVAWLGCAWRSWSVGDVASVTSPAPDPRCEAGA